MEGYEEKTVRTLLKEHKAVLVRSNKHGVWKLPSGSIIVLPSTPSDYRAWKNALSFLNAQLGLNAPDRGAAGERRERRTTLFTRPVPVTPLEAPKLASLCDAVITLHRSSGEFRLQMDKSRKSIQHPVHGSPAPAQEITVDVSGLLTKFGGSK